MCFRGDDSSIAFLLFSLYLWKFQNVFKILLNFKNNDQKEGFTSNRMQNNFCSIKSKIKLLFGFNDEKIDIDRNG